MRASGLALAVRAASKLQGDRLGWQGAGLIDNAARSGIMAPIASRPTG
jgi:hypothetical protein